MTAGLPIIVVVSLLTTFFGLVTLVVGLWPRRRGFTPFCRKCGSNLTGIDRQPETPGERPCPECGLDLTLVDSTVIGKRVRRLRLAVLGLLMAFAGGLPIGQWGRSALQRVDWYTKLPTWWVFDDMRGDDEKVAWRAWSEIESRFSAGALSVGQVSSLIDACLEEHARPVFRLPGGMEADVLLGDSTIETAMTATQRRRYANNLMRNLTLSIRSRVVANKPFKVWFDADDHVPLGRTCLLRLLSFTCNGLDIEGDALLDGSAGWGKNRIAIPHELDESGRAVFKAVVRWELFDAHGPTSETAPPLFASDPIELTAVTEVLPAGTDDVRLVRSESLDAAVVSSAIFFGPVVASAADSDMFEVSFLFGFDPSPPCNLAFDVIVEFEGDWRLLGTIKARTDPNNDGHFAESWRISGAAPEKVDILLRASPDAARATPDMFEIWGGSLRFKDLPVKSSMPSTRPRVRAILDED